MGKVNFSDDFKRDAVAQITERGYPVAEVSQRLCVSQTVPFDLVHPVVHAACHLPDRATHGRGYGDPCAGASVDGRLARLRLWCADRWLDPVRMISTGG